MKSSRIIAEPEETRLTLVKRRRREIIEPTLEASASEAVGVGKEDES
jgi:hypothetical protein